MHLLQVFTGLVSPEHVLKGSRVKVVVNVVESVLGDVTNDQVRVLPDLTAQVGLSLTSEELNKGRFTGTVGTKNGNSR